MVTTVMADVGWNPVNLGPNTPFDVLADSAVEMDAQLVWIAFTSTLPRKETQTQLAKLVHKLSKQDIPTVIGGRTAARYLQSGHRHLNHFSSMAEMAGFVRGLLRAG